MRIRRSTTAEQLQTKFAEASMGHIPGGMRVGEEGGGGIVMQTAKGETYAICRPPRGGGGIFHVYPFVEFPVVMLVGEG